LSVKLGQVSLVDNRCISVGREIIFLVNAFVFIFGIIVGSFLNVVILRLPAEQSIVSPGSHCPHCQMAISWYDNIPLLSFIVLQGRCRGCTRPLSWQYPLVELAGGVFALAVWLCFPPASFLPYFAFLAALVVVVFVDCEYQIIPDVITLPGVIVGLAFALAGLTIGWRDSLLGVILGGGVLYLISAVYFLITKRQGMGGGDIKLLAMIGAFLGYQALPFILFASSLLGTCAGLYAMGQQGKGGKTVIPFGPFLAMASAIYLLCSRQIDSFLVHFFLP